MAEDLKKQILVEFKSNFEEYQRQATEAARSIDQLKDQIKELQKAEGDNTEAIEAARTELRKQQQQYKEATKQIDLYTKATNAAEGSQEQAKAIASIYNKELDKQAGLLEKDAKGNLTLSKSYTEAAKKAKNANDAVNQFNLESKRGYTNVGLYRDAIADLSPRFANVSNRVNIFRGLLGKINPLFLGIGAVVGAAGAAMTSFFTNSEKGAEMLERKMAGLKAAWGVLGNEIIKIGEKLAGTGNGKWGILDKIVDVFSNITMLPLNAIFKETIKNMKDSADAAEEATGKMQELEDVTRDMIVPRAEMNKKIAEAKLLYEDETLSIDERIKALKTSLNLEIELNQKEIDLQNQIVENIKEQNRLKSEAGTLRDADLLKLEEAKAKAIELQTASMMKQRKLTVTIQAAERELRKEQKVEQTEFNNQYIEAEKAAEMAIIDFKKNLRKKYWDDLRQSQLTQAEQELELAQMKGEEAINQEKKLLELRKWEEVRNANETGADVAMIHEKYRLLEIQLDQAQKDLKLSIISGFAGAVAELFGEQTALGKSAALAQATINTYLGATSAFAQTPGPIWVKILAASTAVLTGLTNVRKILAVNTNVSTGNQQAPTASAIPRFVATRVNDTAFTARGNISPITQGQNIQPVSNITNNNGITVSDVKTIAESLPAPIVIIEEFDKVNNRSKKAQIKSNL